VICGAVLAAGGARRFGAPKQLAELHGRPLLEHAVATLASVPLDARAVVLGAHRERIAGAVDLHGLEVVPCADWEEGIAASLRAAVEWARGRGADALVLVLGDQPRVGPPALERVISHRGRAPAVRAVYDGRPGHPVLVERELFEELLALHGDEGGRALLAERGCLIVDCGDVAGAEDVDEPGDLAALR
jgi:molybdenum cofactor cytidylyltransferase